MGGDPQRVVGTPQSAVHSVPPCWMSARLVTVMVPSASEIWQEAASSRSQLEERQVPRLTTTSTEPSGFEVRQRAPELAWTVVVSLSGIQPQADSAKTSA